MGTDTETPADTGAADADTDADTATPGTSLDVCADLAETPCGASPLCQAPYGYGIGDDGGTPCVDRDARTFAGCTEVQTCADQPVTASPPGGECLWFDDDCVPGGWVDCGLGYLQNCP